MQPLEEADQIGCGEKRSGGLGSRRTGAAPAYAARGATDQPGLPGQTSIDPAPLVVQQTQERIERLKHESQGIPRKTTER